MTTQPLLEQSESGAVTKIHYLILLSVAFAKFGESVEFMLPTVITQQVSCDLHLTKRQEHILALAQYASAAVFSIVIITITQRFRRRPIILLSLYLSVLSAIACAIVPDYNSLLLSRILVGMTITIGTIPLSVYLSESCPNKKFHARATVVVSIGWATGGGWCGILGYFLLEKFGWRWFVLSTSIPLFIPSIIAFQFILSESNGAIASASKDNTDSTDSGSYWCY